MTEPAFEVRNMTTGEVMKVWAHGEIEGFPLGFTCVVNRIPGLLAKANEEGWRNALTE